MQYFTLLILSVLKKYETEANHNLNRLLDKPDLLYRKYLFGGGCRDQAVKRKGDRWREYFLYCGSFSWLNLVCKVLIAIFIAQ